MTAIVLRGLAEALPLPDASVDAVVCDPPYALSFMGRSWDAWNSAAEFQSWCEAWAQEAFRVLKPGGHLIAFGGTRTYHRLVCGVEDAGFEIRDQIDWIYASGFPKGVNVAKAIDRTRDDREAVLRVTAFVAAARDRVGLTTPQMNIALGYADMAYRWTTSGTAPEVPNLDQWECLRALLDFGTELDEEVRRLNGRKGTAGDAWECADILLEEERDNAPSGIVDVDGYGRKRVVRQIKAPNTDAARRWQGWNTALKPAHEPIVVARKPLAGTVSANVLGYGTGAINVDGCRIPAGQDYADKCASVVGLGSNRNGDAYGEWTGMRTDSTHDAGRWPTNVVFAHAATPDGEDLCVDGCVEGCPVAELDAQSGITLSSGGAGQSSGRPGSGGVYGHYEQSGGRHAGGLGDRGGASRMFPAFRFQAKASNTERIRVAGTAHETVKPVDLMRWLVRLVTPPAGLVLDPFGGSGTTGEAATREGMSVVIIEQDAKYLPLIRQRMNRLLDPASFRGDPRRGESGEAHLFTDTAASIA